MVLYFPRRIVYAKRKNTELQINLYTSYKSTAFQIHCKIKYRELRTIIYSYKHFCTERKIQL